MTLRWLPCAAMLLASALGVVAEDTTNTAPAGATNVSAVGTPFSRYLSPYEPIYFLMGTYPAAEFKFSLKYQVSAATNGWARFTTNFFLAYTQTSFWDLLSSDPSFYDTDYNPSAFLYFPDVLGGKIEDNVRLDLQGGIAHESNGRGGTGERSLYTAYMQPTVTFGLPDDLQLSLSPRAWMYVIDLSKNNPDMAAYRGYADLRSTLSWKLRPKANQGYILATAYGLGDDGNHYSLKFDFSLSVSQWIRWFTPRIHAQYFTGYGQTLRQYNQSSHGLRAGISLFD
jgi:phospholipase A1/A2